MAKENDKKPVDLKLGALHENEQRLIFAIRNKYRFGELKILTRHGVPYRLKITERFEDLSSDSYATSPIEPS